MMWRRGARAVYQTLGKSPLCLKTGKSKRFVGILKVCPGAWFGLSLPGVRSGNLQQSENVDRVVFRCFEFGKFVLQFRNLGGVARHHRDVLLSLDRIRDGAD